MKAPEKKPFVKLTGADGNAFFIIGTAARALQRAGADKEYIDQFRLEAESGDYDNVLQTVMKHCDVG
ncbi:MAG: hypothetical protein GY841_23510 [FCB group bacterium]|nr:hypothetical protein [FCB group bacterium]